jgi:hypothetical protein
MPAWTVTSSPLARSRHSITSSSLVGAKSW